MALSTDEALRLLGHRHSPHRRRGAERLRVIADRGTAPRIRAALLLELEDERTWETQHQMVVALGVTGDRGDVDLLRGVVATPLRATTVH